MLSRWFVSSLLILVLFVAPAHAEFRAGIADADVTPAKQMPVSGGLGTPGPTTQTKGKLQIRALVLENGDTRVAIVSVPFIGFPGVLADRVRAKVDSVPGTNIMIGSTHTHSAPDMYAFLNETGELLTDLDYIDFVVGKTADAIGRAVSNLKPASIKTATAKAQGKIAYNYYAPKLYDPRVDVLQAIGKDGKPFATLVNYAVHPEVLGPGRGILSPDLVGPLLERIAEQGGGMGIFMNGAQGGMVTADCRGPDGKDIQTWEECNRIGNLLADEALRIVSTAPVQEDPPLWCGSTPLTLPVDNLLFRQIIKTSPLDYKLNDDFSVTTQLNLVNIGTAQMLTIPGEALPNIGYYLKRNMYGSSNFLLGLTNDAFGYMMTKEDFNSFDRYDYICRTSLGEHAADIYVDQALAFVEASPRPGK
jgi:hypothetical protein